ncbi:RIPOR family member 3 [Tamandua tetradactyla]|uniref:RIPOR family member 3 n=1 Tax=Tamandua tetradactyla TaxID=48850 RepID=UPI0040543418
MSVRVRFLSPGDAAAMGAVGRSASFAGFSSSQSRRSTWGVGWDPARPPAATKTPGPRGSLCLDPRPQQVKRMLAALQRGLREHLRAQQAELEHLSGRHKDAQRSSRLAFYYDLDKQTRSVERLVRKMEFHISKVDELYEGYCVQCRLHDGAATMQRAFSRGPPSRASRESLQELGRRRLACAEDMWLIEGALEAHLGEFHIRMKGLVGYARLCPGDHYEVLLRLGRQRWKLRGQIEAGDRQTWDAEERTFVPSLHEGLEIKVTELRGLSSLPVGTVTCDIADFFRTRPQAVVVDVTELGTIKLQLQVLWSPMDNESFLVSPSPSSRLSGGSRRGSLYNWTPPSTPSSRERYQLVSGPRGAPRSQLWAWLPPPSPGAFVFTSDPPHSGPILQGRSQGLPGLDSCGSEDPHDPEPSPAVGCLSLVTGPHTAIKEEAQEDPLPLGLLLERAHLARGQPGEQPSWTDLGRESPSQPRNSPFRSSTTLGSQGRCRGGEPEDGTEGPGMSVARPLHDVLELLRATRPAPAALRELECQVLGFRARLQPPGAPAESLLNGTLDSLSFLSAGLTPEQLPLLGGSPGSQKARAPPLLPSPRASSGELAAGAPELDVLLVAHLRICRTLLQKLASPDLSTMVQESLLEEAARQKQVLEMLSVLDFAKVSQATSVEEILPQASGRKGSLQLWKGCTGPGRVLSCPATTLLNQLKKTFLHRVTGKYPGQLEIVGRRLLEQVVSCGGLVPGVGPPEEQTVTWFQFHSYLQRQGVSDLEKHLAQLSREVALTEELQCSGRAQAVRQLRGKRLGRLLPLPQTLRAWALLQLDGAPRVSRAASARLAAAAMDSSFREKALLFYTNVLAENDAKLQQAACVALRHLKGVESLDPIARLCQSELEAVRVAARETLLSFGEKGRLVFEKMDKICSEKREEVLCQEPDVEITIF